MALSADSLVERRRLRRRIAVWRALAVLAVLGVVLIAFERFDGLRRGPYIAFLRVDGLIVEDRGRVRALLDVAEDADARALLLYINSPGGSVVGGEALYRAARRVADAGKPVIAVIGTLGTSAGYMVALAAERIVAYDGSITGSIGVIMQTTEVTGLLDKLGIRAEAIKSAPLKATPSPLEPLTEPARTAARALVDDMYQSFVDLLAERRRIDAEKARALADGRVFTGRQALAEGLIDEIGTEDEALARLGERLGLGRSPRVRTLGAREDEMLADFHGRAVGKIAISERLRLDGLISVWHPEVSIR